VSTRSCFTRPYAPLWWVSVSKVAVLWYRGVQQGATVQLFLLLLWFQCGVVRCLVCVVYNRVLFPAAHSTRFGRPPGQVTPSYQPCGPQVPWQRSGLTWGVTTGRAPWCSGYLFLYVWRVCGVYVACVGRVWLSHFTVLLHCWSVSVVGQAAEHPTQLSWVGLPWCS
jgi:hypothetical protein